MKILVIEDNLDHFELVEEALVQSSFEDLHLCHEVRLESGLDKLAQEPFDVCLCDLMLPDASVEMAVEKLKDLDTEIPIVILTSHTSSQVDCRLLQEGIQDFLPKNELSPTLLCRMITYAIERKQQQLFLQRENADMQTFCASLSHDFTRHLRHIVNVSRWLRDGISERTQLSSEELEWFQYIDRSTTGIRELVDSLGKFLSVEDVSARNAPIDLSVLLEKLKKNVIETAEKDVQLTIEDNLPCVQGNASQLTILFHNIFSNAIKYNESSPSIHVGAWIDSLNSICHVEVKDNGIGIDKKYFSKIFLPFKRLHGAKTYCGSGLGLSIVKRIVDRHQGRVSLESSLGQGSTFTISLPLALSEEAKTAWFK